MRAVVYRRYGPPGVLEFTDVPEPAVREDGLLVRVRATSVNPVDWKFRSGKARIPFLKLPRITGLDVSGVVVRTGKNITRFKSGDEIFAMLSPFSGGGCAEFAAVPERLAAARPRNLSFEESAAVPLAALTALKSLRDNGGIQSGDRVLINGASGGVGHFAVQIAKIFGAEVSAVTSGKNRDFVIGLGADHAIDYTAGDFTKSDRRYQIIFDAVASRSFRQCRGILSPRGIYLSTLPSVSTAIRMVTGPILGGKRARLVGVHARAEDLELLREWIDAGKLRPHIDRIFPIERTAEAHALSEAGHVRGKIVIAVNGG